MLKRGKKGFTAMLLAGVLVLSFGWTAQAAQTQGSLNQELKYGDVDNNGTVDAADVLELLKVLIGKYQAQPFHQNAGDLNKDGRLSVRDALLLLQNIAKQRDDKLGYAPYLQEIRYAVPSVFADGSAFLQDSAVAFPGADGWGKYTGGGRGGQVIAVTSLADSGPGSLREALETAGKRVIVFRVSGVIYLKSNLSIKNGDVTIAGQTAPGDGITLANYGLSVTAENVIIRYLSIRPGDQTGDELDGLDICGAKNVVVDHCSVSFATDEVLSARPNGEGASYDDVSDKVSVQWCMIAESITQSPNSSKGRHGMGSLIRGAQGAEITYHHNLYVSHSSRLPMMGNYIAKEADDGNFKAEFINNTVFNWSGDASGKCSDADPDGLAVYVSSFNYIGNYYRPGSVSTKGASAVFSEGGIGNHMYMEDNVMEDRPDAAQKELVSFTSDVLATEDNPYYWDKSTNAPRAQGLVIDPESYFLTERFADSEMAQIDEAKDANRAVLQLAGNSLSRDCFDTALLGTYEAGEGRLINQTFEAAGWYRGTPESHTGTAYYEWSQGKYPDRACYPAETDTDQDGMSDVWERAVGLDPADPADGARSFKGSAYTNLDVYLQFLVEQPEAAILHGEAK